MTTLTSTMPNRSRAGRRTRQPAHLTRRGRLVVVLAVLASAALVVSIGQGSSAHGASAAPQPRHVTVGAGETLWQVAVQVAPDRDPRVTVRDLMQLNHLSSPQLRAGQSIVVPPR